MGVQRVQDVTVEKLSPEMESQKQEELSALAKLSSDGETHCHSSAGQAKMMMVGFPWWSSPEVSSEEEADDNIFDHHRELYTITRLAVVGRLRSVGLSAAHIRMPRSQVEKSLGCSSQVLLSFTGLDPLSEFPRSVKCYRWGGRCKIRGLIR